MNFKILNNQWLISKKQPNILKFNFIMITFIAIVAVLINKIPNYSDYSSLFVIFSILLGLPLIIGLFFSVFYVIINAFEKTNRTFLNSLNIFIAITLPLILTLDIIKLLTGYTLNNILYSLSSYLVVFLVLYYIFFSVNFMKKYFSVDYFKLFASYIFTLMFFMLGIFILYINYLINNLR